MFVRRLSDTCLIHSVSTRVISISLYFFSIFRGIPVLLFFGVAGTVLSINAAEKFGSSLVSGIILAATLNLFLGYLLMPIISTMIAFKAYCATLKKWCISLKDQPQLLERDGLCKYLKALDMADNVLSDSVFHFSVGASLCALVSLYRAYSLSIGKNITKFMLGSCPRDFRVPSEGILRVI